MKDNPNPNERTITDEDLETATAQEIPPPGPTVDVDAVAQRILELSTGGNHVTSITLVDPETGAEQAVTLAIPSGSRRIRFYNLEATRPEDKMRRGLYEAMVAEARAAVERGEDPNETIGANAESFAFKAVVNGAMPIEALLGRNTVTAKDREEQTRVTIQQAQLAIDTRQLSTLWKERVASYEWMAEQDIRDLEAFAASFRRRIDGRGV